MSTATHRFTRTSLSSADGTASMSLGGRIRHERKLSRRTLSQLAGECGISTSFLSQIERDQAKPSVGTLHRVADALGVTLADLFVAEHPPATRPRQKRALAEITRAGDRKGLVYPGSGIRNELLTPDLRRAIQMMWIVIPPGEGTGDEPLVHEGEECGLVLQGEIEVFMGVGDEQESYILTAGDAIYTLSTIPHRSRNVGTTDAIIVAAITPPSF